MILRVTLLGKRREGDKEEKQDEEIESKRWGALKDNRYYETYYWEKEKEKVIKEM